MAEEKPQVHPVSKFLYHIVLFFAYWFGAHRFDVDGDGDFDPEDVEKYLSDKGWVSKNFRQTKTAKRRTKKKKPAANKDRGGGVMDRNGDGQVDGEDIFQSTVSGQGEEAEIMENLLEKQLLPWFIILQCLVCLGFWFVMAMIGASDQPGTDPLQMKAGVDSLDPGKFDLRLSRDCEDLRFEVWRWFTYQWTHVGAMHVLMNVFLCVMLGIPLEGIHGGFRMMFMFNVGVFGGACCFFVNDAHTIVVGCSGGCYALIGMHVADLIMNWSAKKYRKPTLFFIVLLIGVDIFSYSMSLSAENTSHSAHVGGAIAGLIIGVVVGVNKKVEQGELALKVVFTFIGFVLMAFCLIWLGLNTVPLNIWEASRGELEYCWVRQVYNASLRADKWLCVRCRDQQCIRAWDYMKAAPVSKLVCNAEGWYYGFKDE